MGRPRHLRAYGCSIVTVLLLALAATARANETDDIIAHLEFYRDFEAIRDLPVIQNYEIESGSAAYTTHISTTTGEKK